MPPVVQNYAVAMLGDGLHEQLIVESELHHLRLPTADKSDPSDRGHLCFTRIDSDSQRLRIHNQTSAPVHVGDQLVSPGETVAAKFPISIQWKGGNCIAFQPRTESEIIHGCLPSAPAIESNHQRPKFGPINHSPSPETLSRWFKTMVSIQKHAATTEEFHVHAIRAIVDPGGMDTGMLVERQESNWKIRTSHSGISAAGISFEPAFVDLVYRRREPLVFTPSDEDVDEDVDHGVALFGAPVFNAEMEVAAVLYGSRYRTASNRRRHVRELEALWIRLIAEAITAGYVRMAHEAKAARQQILLEQAFPAEVIRQLSSVRSTLDLPSEDKEVTLMFADLIDSSSLCEMKSPDVIVEFLADVMDSWTEIVHRHGGVVVDYYGDGLIAMWNAPVDQPDHAIRACKAGLAIQQHHVSTSGRWEYELGKACQFGIGIHTGKAIIGNSGSRRRLKYGPRGFSVNLANRIEKATRTLGQTVLISAATRAQLDADVSAYRLGRFRLWGIEQPVELHALHSMSGSNSANACCVTKHRKVMQLIETEDFRGAAEHLDSCVGCALDELSLGFLKKKLTSLSLVDDQTAAHDPPVFDLTEFGEPPTTSPTTLQ